MELIQLKREAKLKGGFYVDPEAKLLFIIRIRGYAIYGISVILVLILDARVLILITVNFGTFSINAMDPKSRKILQLLRLRQVKHHIQINSL
jgi:large subunit ribosomal protein L7e